jgi:hypothetical protein
VLSTNFTGAAPSSSILARIFSVKGANWSSTRKLPPAPLQSKRLPPRPASMWTPGASSVASITTSCSWAVAASAQSSAVPTASLRIVSLTG